MADAAKKLLLLGDTGKMGSAVRHLFGRDHEIVGVNRRHFDAEDFEQVAAIVERERPDLLVNAIAFLGIDACEKDPTRALRLNTLLPKRLAELSRDHHFILVHFSSDAVFGDVVDRYCLESDPVNPFNVYALTKYGGDCFVQATSRRYYIFRLPVLFGESAKQDQFVEKMLARARAGERRLEISSDVVSTPSYSRDVAAEMRRVIYSELPAGLYHVRNEGRGSLFEIVKLLVDHLGLGVDVEPVSHRRFPSLGRKNTYTTMGSEKIASLRPWRTAFREYCEALRIPVRRGELARTGSQTRVRDKCTMASAQPGPEG